MSSSAYSLRTTEGDVQRPNQKMSNKFLKICFITTLFPIVSYHPVPNDTFQTFMFKSLDYLGGVFFNYTFS